MRALYQFRNFYHIIEENVKKSPKKTVIFEDGLKVSNLKFQEKIDSVSEFLLSSGVQVHDKVAIVMSNSWQYIVNIFAISKIGAIVVPINNFLKEEELAYILNDSDASLLFSSYKFASETKGLLKKTKIKTIVWVDGCSIENTNNVDYSKIGTINQANSKVRAYPSTINDTAMIVYTSGTTGKPKGAMLSFKNIFSNCQGALDLMKFKKDGSLKMLSYLPMFHAFTLTATVFLPIYTNSGVVIIRSINSIRDFKNLLKQLLLHRCLYFTGVPEIYNAMTKRKLPWYFHWFHNVRGFISGAAPLSKEVHTKFSTLFKRGKLIEGYGISECSPIVSCNSPENSRVGSVGRPLTGYQVKILDDKRQEVPIGETGEIYVKGDCVMQGYYKRPEETKEAIVDGWFRTEDIGKVDADGYIYIVDRLKDLIIHKGMNIYPREIEEVLHTHPKINACAVVGEKDSEGNEIPIAYIELKEHEVANKTLNENEIKNFLRPHLAVFKMPRRVIFIDKLPRNQTGKVLKRELCQLK